MPYELLKARVQLLIPLLICEVQATVVLGQPAVVSGGCHVMDDAPGLQDAEDVGGCMSPMLCSLPGAWGICLQAPAGNLH